MRISSLAAMALTLSGPAMTGLGAARPDVEPVLYATPEEEAQLRAEAQAANARAAARAARGSKANPVTKRRRKAERAARKKNRR